MTKKNETVVKIAQTALMAALCFVSFQFLQFKIVLPGGRRNVFSCRKCILRTGSTFDRRCIRWIIRCHRNGNRRPDGSCIYHRRTKDILY